MTFRQTQSSMLVLLCWYHIISTAGQVISIRVSAARKSDAQHSMLECTSAGLV